MSKTKGNVVDPLGVIDETGADALRFALIHGAARGTGPAVRDGQARERPQLREQALERDPLRGRRPAGVARRAARERRSPTQRHLGPAERWLRSRAAATVEAVDGAMAEYAFGEVTRLVYDAIWSEYCDWGLELAKVRLTDHDAARRRPRGDVVDAGRGARHVPAPAPPGHAVRDGGALGARSRTGATDPELLIVARWPAVGERDLAAEAELEADHRLGRRDPERALDGAAPCRRPARDAGCTSRRRWVPRSKRCARRSSGWPVPARSIAC